jgi:hypothetical protein
MENWTAGAPKRSRKLDGEVMKPDAGSHQININAKEPSGDLPQ